MYIDITDIYNKTDNGLDIILSYYPAAKLNGKPFKIRSTEKTPSASLKLIDGVWKVTDFGDEGTPLNPIEICMKEENIDFKTAINLLAEKYHVGSVKSTLFKPDFKETHIDDFELEFTDYTKYIFNDNKECTNEELAVLGKYVTNKDLKRYKLFSVSSYHYKKEDKIFTFSSNENYPIFCFVDKDADGNEWRKIYQPKALEKANRFRYAGPKPKDHWFGLDDIRKEFKKNKEESQYEEANSEKNDPRFDKIIIASGGSDGLNLASLGYHVIWANSETALIQPELIKDLFVMAQEVYYLGDIDKTGVKQAVQIGLKYLDIKLIWLPNYIKQRKDWRGNPMKDFKDYLEFHKYKNKRSLQRSVSLLLEQACPMRFWDKGWNEKQKKETYFFNHTYAYHFLKHNGFYRMESKNLKEGFTYIQIEGNKIKEITPYEVRSFVNDFLEQRQLPIDLRNTIYKSKTALGDSSLANLPKIEIDFTDFTQQSQFMFFENGVIEISKDKINQFRPGELYRFVWDDEEIKHKFKIEDPYFNIAKDKSGNWNIEIVEEHCDFFKYLINTSRIHWRKELEKSWDKEKEELIQDYFKQNQFNIAGSRLNTDEIFEQKLHLINKIFVIGYLVHRYKDEARAYCATAMDNIVSEDGLSYGGSGKSIFGRALSSFMKDFYLPGRNPKTFENPHVYDGLSEHHDLIVIDDANQYFPFDKIYTEITGDLTVNPKNNKQFLIPFKNVGKYLLSTNYTIRDQSPSTERRIVYLVFSDYYHYQGEKTDYKESRSVKDDLGYNMFSEWNDTQWNKFYNFIAQCVQFYLHAVGDHKVNRLNPPMGNVTKRNLITEMNVIFKDWADTQLHLQLNKEIEKTTLYNDFVQKTNSRKWTANRFTKSLKAWCKFYNYQLNPSEMAGKDGRIIRSKNGTTVQVLYIKGQAPHDLVDVEAYQTTDNNWLDDQNETRY